MRFRIPLVALLILAFWSAPAATDEARQATRARALLASAQRRLAVGSPEQRQFALRELEEAAHLDPDDSDVAVALGRLYLDGDLLQRAFDVANRLAARDTSDARAMLLQGLAWRRRWLAESDPDARDRAILELARAGRRNQADFTCWSALMPLLVDAEESDLVEMVAHLAARAEPRNPEGALMVATAAQLRGDLATAAEMFGRAIPALRPRRRAGFHDLAPLLPPSQAASFRSMNATRRARFEEGFWRQNDPDPISSENEAQLEFWARLTLATLLYGESRDDLWDMRAEYYVRFGRPEVVQLNPGEGVGREGDWLAWAYPRLGMRVWMGSPSAFVGFRNAFTTNFGWATPAPESLASHGELHATSRSWAVFHKFPAGVELLQTRFASAHFESDHGPRLLAKAEVHGGPEDHFTAEWVVMDSALNRVHEETANFTVSACRPGEVQSAGLSLPLDPGRYRVAMRAIGADGRRAVFRRDVVLARPVPGLALSDLVLTCGDPSTSVVPGQGVRLELDTGLDPEPGDRLRAYFEIYRLDADEGGAGRFEYECVVRPASRDRRGWLSRMFAPGLTPVALSMSRSEQTRGGIRRQFVEVPVHDLPPGPYRLEIRVSDKVSGEVATSSTPFARAETVAPARP